MNSTWDIYTNDCANLVRSEKDTKASVLAISKEHQSYYDRKIIADKVINDLCWHPFWTGTPIATYTQHARSEHLIGPKTFDEVWQLFRKLFLKITFILFVRSIPKLILKKILLLMHFYY